jgi:hypothetical protein
VPAPGVRGIPCNHGDLTEIKAGPAESQKAIRRVRRQPGDEEAVVPRCVPHRPVNAGNLRSLPDNRYTGSPANRQADQLRKPTF